MIDNVITDFLPNLDKPYNIKTDELVRQRKIVIDVLYYTAAPNTINEELNAIKTSCVSPAKGKLCYLLEYGHFKTILIK